MGHFCRICKRSRANEKFSGRGHRSHVCKECACLPRQVREESEQFDELFGFLTQSRISEKNCARLEELAQSPNADIADRAQLILEIAQVKPGKRRRLKFLRHEHPDLLKRLEDTELIFAHHW